MSVSRLESGIDKYTAYRRMDSIKTFERQLTDDGYVIVKFFLHISQKEQSGGLTSWNRPQIPSGG